MSNSVVKQERGCALVCGTRKGRGRFTTRLTTPLRSRAFLMRSFWAQERLSPMATGISSVCDELALDPAIAARARCIREGNGFESRPDALAMSIHDIKNISRLTAAQTRVLLDAIGQSLVEDNESESWDWDDSDARWELTPHQLRKLNEAKRKVKRMAKL